MLNPLTIVKWSIAAELRIELRRLEKRGSVHIFTDWNSHKHANMSNVLTSVEYGRTATNFTVVTHLAYHGGPGPQSRSLYALVGPFPSEANEELKTMNGFPSFR